MCVLYRTSLLHDQVLPRYGYHILHLAHWCLDMSRIGFWYPYCMLTGLGEVLPGTERDQGRYETRIVAQTTGQLWPR